MDSFEEIGEFWFPETPDTKFYGNLTYNPSSGVEVNLLISVDDYIRLDIEHLMEPNIILGHTVHGKKVTLLYCYQKSNNSNSPRVNHIPFSAELMLEGECFNQLEEIQFQAISVRYTQLEGWMFTNSALKSNTKYNDEETIYEIRYQHSAFTEVKLDSLDSHLFYGLGLSGPMNLGRRSIQATWEQVAFIEIFSEQKRDLHWFIDISREISYLLTILIGFAVYNQSLEAYQDGSVNDSGLPTLRSPITIFRRINYAPSKTEIPSELMLLAIEHLGSSATVVFQRWFEKKELIGSLSKLVLGVLYRGHKIPEFEFLALMQALEGYHHVKNPNCLRQDSKKNKNRECSLLERLEELHDLLSPEECVLGIGQKDYLKKLISTRNHYTHRKRKPNAVVFEGERLRGAIFRLECFALTLIYKELSIPDSLIPDALRRKHHTYRIWGY